MLPRGCDSNLAFWLGLNHEPGIALNRGAGCYADEVWTTMPSMRSNDDVMSRRSMIDEIRRIRERTSEPKDASNARYHGLSTAMSGINKAIDDLRREG